MLLLPSFIQYTFFYSSTDYPPPSKDYSAPVIVACSSAFCKLSYPSAFHTKLSSLPHHRSLLIPSLGLTCWGGWPYTSPIAHSIVPPMSILHITGRILECLFTMIVCQQVPMLVCQCQQRLTRLIRVNLFLRVCKCQNGALDMAELLQN